jgi:hypothetical protein
MSASLQPETPASAPSNVSAGLNVERIITDHIPPRIAELESECQALVAKLGDRMAELTRLKLLQTVSHL